MTRTVSSAIWDRRTFQDVETDEVGLRAERAVGCGLDLNAHVGVMGPLLCWK